MHFTLHNVSPLYVRFNRGKAAHLNVLQSYGVISVSALACADVHGSKTASFVERSSSVGIDRLSSVSVGICKMLLQVGFFQDARVC